MREGSFGREIRKLVPLLFYNRQFGDRFMKRTGNLWPELVSFENLYEAYSAACKHKRYTNSCSEFSAHREEYLLALQEELSSLTYLPGEYRQFTIYEPKKRLISAAPFRDRVVHHALVNVLEPVFEPTFISDSYATRIGKGTHRAILKFESFFKQYRFVLKCDIERYFPSIDHEVLLSLIERKIKCPATLRLIRILLAHSPQQDTQARYFPGDNLFTPFDRPHGLPIGNLTSQFFANVYLDPIDHLVKEELRFQAYLRYMDDFCLFANTKAELWDALETIRQKCARFRLTLKPSKTRIYSTAESVEFLGFRQLRTHRRLNARVARRSCRNLGAKYRQLCKREITNEEFRSSLMSINGHYRWGNCSGLAKSSFGDFLY